MARTFKRRMIKAVKVILGLLILAVVGLGILWGIIDPREIRDAAHNKVAGATGSVKSALAVDSSVSPAAAQRAALCRENLKRIESAKRAIHSRGGFATGAVSWTEVEAHFGGALQVPRCPGGGEYYLGTMEQMARCSIGGNGTPDRGDDHLVIGF